MIENKCVKLFLYLCTMLLTFNNFSANQETLSERTQTMHENQNKSSSAWFQECKNTPEYVMLSACNKLNQEVIIEWHKTSMISPDFAEYMKKTWDVVRSSYIPVEVEFLRKYPEVVGKEAYFKPFEPLFNNGFENVNWQSVEQTTESILKNFFVFDPASFNETIIKLFGNDILFFASVKDRKTEQLLGFIVFLVKQDYAYGEVKVTHLAIAPEMQNQGLAKLLISSIFKILPNTQRIFLGTRVTNKNAIQAYNAWGFVKDINPKQDPHHIFNLNHWIFMEYLTNRSGILQKASEHLTLK